MYEIRTRKNELRSSYKERRRRLEPERKQARDKKICTVLSGLASYRFADVLLLFSPQPDEIDINPIIDGALSQGKRVALPRCLPGTPEMRFHFITSRDELVPGSFGLLEPPEDSPVYDTNSNESALCVVPALVFDRAGFRLGYGKGYYDRYLPGFKGTTVGVIYEDFIVSRVPRGRYDLAVDVVVTDKGVKAFNAD